jgi:hypothetical protein
MPYIQFDLPRDPSTDDFNAVARRVAHLYAEVMQTTPSGVTVAERAEELGAGRSVIYFTEGPGRLILRRRQAEPGLVTD